MARLVHTSLNSVIVIITFKRIQTVTKIYSYQFSNSQKSMSKLH